MAFERCVDDRRPSGADTGCKGVGEMCFYQIWPANSELLRDIRRCRFADHSRFYRLEIYAWARLRKSNGQVHYRLWQKIIESVQRRNLARAG